MAIMTNIVKPFRGTCEEDIDLWLQAFKILADANEIPNEHKPKIFVCCLKDTALQ